MDNDLFQAAVNAIIATARQAYFEGYNQCEEDYQTRSNPKDVNVSWEMSDAKESCNKMIKALSN